MQAFKVTDTSEAKGAAGLVLLWLAWRSDSSGVAWPCLKTLARETSLQKSTLCAALNRLEESGLVIRERGGGAQRSTHYFLPWVKESPEAKAAISIRQPDEVWSAGQNSVVKSVRSSGQKTVQSGRPNCPVGVPIQSNQSDPINNPESHRDQKHTRQTASRDAVEQRFEEFKSIYPDREGSQRWRAAKKACRARLREGHSWTDLLAGAERYRNYCREKNIFGGQFVKQAATFCGPELHFLERWSVAPEGQPSSYAERLAAQIRMRGL